MKKMIIVILILSAIIASVVTIYFLSRENNNKFDYNLSIKELKERTSEEHFYKKVFLTENSPEYLNLEEGDKMALKYLVKAASYTDNINYALDNHHNLDVQEWLNEQCKKNNDKAILTKKLFDAQKGINAVDYLAKEVNLIKEIKTTLGKGFYPEDLTIEEFHSILINMIKEGKIDEVKTILNQHSVVVRDGKELKGIDYVEYFKNDFENIALCLEEAAKVSTNKDFNEFLTLQAKALRSTDPMIDAYAEKKWAELQYTPLEFTIIRENYEDEITPSITENEELSKLLEKNNIKAVDKDSIGGRVGIVNYKGTDELLKVKNYLPYLASVMPYNTEYEQMITNKDEIKQTMVDVDLVGLYGESGACRGGLTIAENLPNDDKLSLTIGGGRRNVYHRQVRFVTDYKKLEKKLDAILDLEQHKNYNEEASHLATILHENAHSLGPLVDDNKLGKYANILEENKADMAALFFVDGLTEKGMYTTKQRNEILVTEVLNNFIKAKPDFSQAHRVRTVMQNKFLFDHGAYIITDEGKVHINVDKVCSAAKQMLDEIIRIQIDGDINKAEEYINRNFVWTEEMNLIAHKLNEIDTDWNGYLDMQLADDLLK